MVAFIEKTMLTTSTISPVEIGLAYCQTRSSPAVASIIKAVSVLATPLDYSIQIIVTPIWILFDDLKSNSTFSDWIMTPLRLPVKLLFGTAINIIGQFVEMTQRMNDICSLDSNELFHQYKGKWNWLTQKEPSEIASVTIPKLPDEKLPRSIMTHNGQEVITSATEFQLVQEERVRIGRLITPYLVRAGYTHLYVLSQIFWTNTTPPNLFEEDGAFLDDLEVFTKTTRSKTSFVLAFLGRNHGMTEDEIRTGMMNQKELKDTGKLKSERFGTIFLNSRLYRNLRRYSILPLQLINQLNNLPPAPAAPASSSGTSDEFFHRSQGASQ